MVAIDTSNVSKIAFDTAVKHARPETDKMYIVAIADVSPDSQDAVIMDTRQNLVPFEEICSSHGISHDMLVIPSDHPGKALCKAASDYSIDCLVLGRRSMGAIQRMMTASTSKYCVENAPCNVMVVKYEESTQSPHVEQVQPAPEVRSNIQQTVTERVVITENTSITQAERDLQVAAAEVRSIRDQRKAIVREVGEIEQREHEVLGQIRELEDSLDAGESRLAETERALERALQQIKQGEEIGVQRELEVRQREMELLERINSLDNDLNREKAERLMELSRERSVQNALADKLRDFEHDVELLRMELDERDNRIAALREVVEDKEKDIDMLKRDIEQRQYHVEELNKEIAIREDEIDLLRSELDDRHVDLDRLKMILSERDSEIERLNSLLEEKESENETCVSRLRVEIDSREDDIDKMVKACSDKELELVKLRDEVAMTTEENTTLIDTLKTREGELFRAQKDVDRFKAELQSKNEEFERLKADLGFRSSELDRLRSLIQKSEDEFFRMEKEKTEELENARREVLTTQSLIESLRSEVVSREDELKRLRHEAGDMANVVQNQRELLLRKEGEILQIYRQMELRDGEIAGLRKEVEEKDLIVQHLRDENALRAIESATWKEEIRRVETERMSAITAQHQEQIAKLEEILRELRSQLTEEQERRRKVEVDYDAKRNELYSLIDEYAELVSQEAQKRSTSLDKTSALSADELKTYWERVWKRETLAEAGKGGR